MGDTDSFAQGLCRYLDQSHTMYHSTAAAVALLRDSGYFQQLHEGEDWQLEPGRGYFLTRNESSLLAFICGTEAVQQAGMLLALAHTDSPTFRLKNRSARVALGQLWMGLEAYGSPMFATWLDRDLALAGRAVSYREGKTRVRLLDSREAIASIPNLAIHLHQQFNDGFKYNVQQHLQLLLGRRESVLGPEEKFPQELARLFELADDETPELFLYDPQPARLLPGGLLASGRIDNLAMVYAQLWTLLACAPNYRGSSTLVCCLVDSEEIGNLTYQGGESDFIRRTLERLVLAAGGSRQDFLRACAKSFLLSMDGAHASHPAFPDSYDAHYPLLLGGGPALKLSSGVSYSTNFATARRVESVAQQHGIPLQWAVARSDQKTGRTVGPPVAADLGIAAVDLGAGQLAMHSVRELAAVDDIEQTARLLQHIFLGD